MELTIHDVFKIAVIIFVGVPFAVTMIGATVLNLFTKKEGDDERNS